MVNKYNLTIEKTYKIFTVCTEEARVSYTKHAASINRFSHDEAHFIILTFTPRKEQSP